MTAVCRVLLIEDDRDEAVALERACCPDPTAVAFEVVNDAWSAEEALRAAEYDLIICDLALPPDQRRFDPDTGEGLRLFHVIRDELEGTPVIILSGHADLHMMQPFFQASRDGDLYGTRTDQPLVEFFPKEQLQECVEAVKSHIARTAQLDRLEIELSGDLELGLSDQRALRIYGRRLGAVRCHAEPLDGGLSDARTLKVSYIDAEGEGTGTVVAKLGPLRSVVQEAEKYEQVAARLPYGLGAHLLYVVRAGAGRRGALIYQLADQYTTSLFGLVASDDAAASATVEQLAGRLRNWTGGAITVDRPLTGIRRPLITDVKLGESGAATYSEREVEVTVRETMAHGDLHGLNVLVDPTGAPTLIDYGDVRRANAALDPVTLELSVVYHPAMAGQLGAWPSVDQAAQWLDLDRYCDGCPVESFVRTCREWAYEVSAGPGEVLATAYAYSMRQMKYDDDEAKQRAAAVAEATYRELCSMTAS